MGDVTGMHNPFQEKIDEHEDDVDYIQRALTGNAAALEALILRHQSWIFNIALNMTGDIHRAEDITREILIIIISKLATYDQNKASFRTWLYRIVANHVINMKQSKKEQFYAAHAETFDFNASMPNLPDSKCISPMRDKEFIDETRNYCTLCILLCLNRMERIVLILGAIFEVTDRMRRRYVTFRRRTFGKFYHGHVKKFPNIFKEIAAFLKKIIPASAVSR